MLTTAVLEHLRYGDDVRGAVELSMSWLQATVAIVTRVVERLLRILRTAVVVVLRHNNNRESILTSDTHRYLADYGFGLRACSHQGLVLHYDSSYSYYQT